MRKVVSICWAFLFFISCSDKSKQLKPEGYIQYMEDRQNGTWKKVDAGKVVYGVELITPEYMAAKELSHPGVQMDTVQFKKRVQELNGYTFFYIKMAAKNSNGTTEGTVMTDQGHADEMAMYYGQAAQSDITLIQGAKELHPIVYQFENNYGLSPDNTIIVGFETGAIKEDLTITFNDQYTRVPLIRAGFSQKNLSQLPIIQLN